MDYKNGKIAQQIIALQNEDGTWGNEFHSLAIPNGKKALTTEQALRRLKILGFSIQDKPIQRAVDCMTACLHGERRIDNYWEKTLDWDLYTKLMLSTWVRIFDPDNEIAVKFARHWARIIEKAFSGGTYSAEAYQKAYQEEFYKSAKGVREIGFVTFYHVNLLQGLLSKETESRMLDYVINHENGIYYVYGKQISKLPDVFASLETSRYLSAVEILSGYELSKQKLGFVVKWLEDNADEHGEWDLGAKAKDNLYFPLSDAWRCAEYRKADCTGKVQAVLNHLKSC